MILERVRKIIFLQLDTPEDIITEESLFIDDLGADSLDIVDLVMSLEEEFDISIPDEQVEQIHTVGDVIRYLEYQEVEKW